MQSRRQGGLSPPNTAPTLPKLNYEAYKSLKLNFRMSSPPWTNVKLPYWILSGDGSEFMQPREFLFLSFMVTIS